MPHLQSIELEYGDRVQVLAINFADKDSDPAAFSRESGFDFTFLLEGDAVASAYRIFGTPGVVVIDQDREVRFDLRSLKLPPEIALDETSSDRRRAAFRAPYWAAAIRTSIDEILSGPAT